MQKVIIKLIGFYVNLIALFTPTKAAQIAIDIFATPRKGKPTEGQKQFLDSAEKNQITFDDLSLMTYHWRGEKETILLAHGWESNAARWKALIQILKKLKYNIVAIDAPAHGMSDGQSFNAILYASCLEVAVSTYSPDIIIGHSVGGMASVFLVHEHGQQSLKKLVLLGAPAHFQGVLERYIDLMGFNNRTFRAIEKFILTKYGHEPRYFSAADFTESFNIKGLVLHDEQDRIIPYEDALLYEKSYKSSQLISTQGLGHSLRDKNVYSSIIDFIESP
ncbi:MAG: alpha/beta hydrolase [Bacteroidia bacterium]|nr:alpha/beta hydrolase [Bacteroidia bacterium]MBT8269281.1 alpha/beta hydrolase [Bacteroidia bacterium]NNF83435.1 alpha/beta hydrolase [Flavobacteriaceae bacterium]NNK69443.1 alpha/beta hydrolase [Flavobacteriaceae bacterium]NNL81230.1 alpha/beta hydrolase [Flavobacteriaceae bacterium]